MWFISKYLSYSTPFTCCIIQICRMQRPWLILHSIVAFFGLQYTFGQTGATPVASQFARPLPITQPRILGADTSNARDPCFHSPVALPITQHTWNRLVQRPWTPISLGRCTCFTCPIPSRQLQRPCHALHSGVGLTTSYSFARQKAPTPVALVHSAVGLLRSTFLISGCYNSTPLKKNFVLEIHRLIAAIFHYCFITSFFVFFTGQFLVIFCIFFSSFTSSYPFHY